MRHLWSFLLSLLLTPLIYISAGFSAVKFSQATDLGLGRLGVEELADGLAELFLLLGEGEVHGRGR